MSLPSRGMSPLMQRDYGLIQSSSYSSSSAAYPIAEESDEEADAVEQRSETLASMDEDDEEADGFSQHESRAGEDSMSHLSIDGVDPDRTATPRRPSATGAASAASQSHDAGMSTSYYARTGRGAPLTMSAMEAQDALMSPPNHFHHHPQQHAPPHNVAGLLSSSLLLGGDAVLPPPGADMRTEEEAGAEWEDNDPTPMPGRALQESWLSRPPLTRQQLEAEQQQQQLQAPTSTDAAHSETSPLLSQQRSPSGGPKPSAHRLSSAGYHSILSSSDAGAPYRGGPPHASGSAWENIANLAAPHAPNAEVIDEIYHEPTEHIRRRELGIVTMYSLPVWGTHLLELSLNVVSVFSIGHLGTIQLAAASLSTMTANVTGLSLLSGYISALDSLLPPAFTQQPKRVGVYSQSMAIIVAGLCIPIGFVWFYAEYLLLALGQEPEVARLSGVYLRVLLPGLPAYAGFEVCRRYLQAQGLMSASTVVLCFVSPLNAVMNYLLVWGPDSIRLGFIGAPLAGAISNWIMFILALGQCYIAPRTAWGGWSLSSALKPANLLPCLSLGFYGFLAISSEWWAWEISSLMTSLLGTTPLAAQSVLLVCSSIFYQQPYAIAVAAAVRVGNLLGARKQRDAKISSYAGIALSLGSGVINSSIIVIFRGYIARLFSEDPVVIDLLLRTLPLLALFQVTDGVAGVTGGILRGTGRQALGAYLNIVAYYVIALPLGTWLTFKGHYGLPGMWMGLTVALTISSAGGLWLVLRTDWDKELEKVQARMVDGEGFGGGHGGASTAVADHHDPGASGLRLANGNGGQRQRKTGANGAGGPGSSAIET